MFSRICRRDCIIKKMLTNICDYSKHSWTFILYHGDAILELSVQLHNIPRRLITCIAMTAAIFLTEVYEGREAVLPASAHSIRRQRSGTISHSIIRTYQWPICPMIPCVCAPIECIEFCDSHLNNNYFFNFQRMNDSVTSLSSRTTCELLPSMFSCGVYQDVPS